MEILNLGAIATVAVACDDKKYPIQLYQPKATRLHADSIDKSEESKETSDNVSKNFFGQRYEE